MKEEIVLAIQRYIRSGTFGHFHLARLSSLYPTYYSINLGETETKFSSPGVFGIVNFGRLACCFIIRTKYFVNT